MTNKIIAIVEPKLYSGKTLYIEKKLLKYTLHYIFKNIYCSIFYLGNIRLF
jgi:hypothetical protein